MLQNLRPRGRPPQFERAQVDKDVQKVFWARGFDGSSIADLTQATGLFKASLYGVYGDKRAMYLHALDDYLAEGRGQLMAAMAAPTLRESIDIWYAWGIQACTRHADAPGCFMLRTTPPLMSLDPEVAQRVRRTHEHLHQHFVVRCRRAIADGELPGGTDAEILSGHIVSVCYAASTLAMAGWSRERLSAFAADLSGGFLRTPPQIEPKG